jgi:hypothetical protein
MIAGMHALDELSAGARLSANPHTGCIWSVK